MNSQDAKKILSVVLSFILVTISRRVVLGGCRESDSESIRRAR
jgi:hypothetical protein